MAAGVAHVDHPKKKESSTTWITDTSRSNPTSDDFVPASLGLDRRRFLHVAGIAGLGIAAGGRRVRADDEPLKPAEAKPSLQTTVEEVTKPSPCGNSPLGGPFYPAKTDITPPNDLGPGKGTKVLIDLDRAWPTGQPIIVKFLNGQNDPWARQVQQKVREIAPTWCDYANLSMQFVDNGPCHMTVNFQPFSDQFGQHGAGTFNCFLGTDCFKLKNQVQSMNLIFSAAMQQYPADFRESEFQRLVLHEFGHALGMIHEHQRPDRDVVFVQALFSYAQTNWGWNADIVRQQILQKEILKNLVGTVFDEESIMMYEYPQGIAFHQKEGAPPNTPDLSSPFATKRNTKLTALDKVAAAVTYPKPGVALIGEDSLTLGADARAGRLTAAGQVAPFVFNTTAPGGYTVTVGGSMPALVGLMNERGGRDTRGSLANILAAAETTGPEGSVLKAKNLEANRGYFVQVRPLKPMKDPDAGDFTIQVQQGA